MTNPETYERTNTDVTYERLRDDLIHEAHRLKAEIVVLGLMLEEEHQLHRGRKPWTWLDSFQSRLDRELGHTLYRNTHLSEYLNSRR